MNPLIFHPENHLTPKQGRMLVSVPFLTDTYFSRSVILMCDHDQEGSFGLILNRYLDVGLPDLVDGLPAIDTRVSLGGPVNNTNLYFLHNQSQLIEGGIPITKNVCFGGNFEQVRDLLNAGVLKPGSIRFFVGYSGWGENQLDQELEEKSWFVSEVNSLPLIDTPEGDLWSLAMKNMGGDFANLAHFPSNPSFN